MDEYDPANALIDATVAGFIDLPILARLRFARNILLGKGGDRAHMTYDPELAIATEVLMGAIRILEVHPRAARLNDPKL